MAQLPPEVQLEKDEIARQNAETIRKQGEQDINGKSTAPDLSIPTGSALDNLRNAAIAQKKTEAGVQEDDVEPTIVPEVEKKEVTPEVTPEATPQVTEAEKIAKAKEIADAEIAAAKAKEVAALKEQAEALFKDTPQLPPNASPKSSEAFATLKLKAAEQVNALTKQVEELTKIRADLEAKTKEPIPAEISKELEDLRTFRARLDIETDPKWKEFDAKTAQDAEFVYVQLKRGEIPDSTIADIKKYGGPGNVKMANIVEAIKDPIIRNIVSSKLADIDMAAYQKSQAIAKAKEDVKKYQEERSKEWESSATAHNTATQKAIADMTAKVPWLNKVTVDLKDETKRKEGEAHNAYAEQMRKELELASTDDSAEMRATLLVGMVNLFRVQAAYEVLNKVHTEATTKSKKEIEDLTAQVTRLKAAGTNRLRTSVAPGSGAAAAAPTISVNTKAGDALDQLRAQKIASSQT